MPKASTKKTLTIEQVGSPIRRPYDQRETLVGLGLNKMHRRRVVTDNAAIRGMINKIRIWSASSRKTAYWLTPRSDREAIGAARRKKHETERVKR